MKSLNIDIVLECSGKYKTAKDLNLHLLSGAKKVLVSYPVDKNIKHIVHTSTNCFAEITVYVGCVVDHHQGDKLMSV